MPKEQNNTQKKVGYKNPPKEFQWKKGCKSPNPLGRPKKPKTFKEALLLKLSSNIQIEEDGTIVNKPCLDLLLENTIKDAINTDGQSRKILFSKEFINDNFNLVEYDMNPPEIEDPEYAQKLFEYYSTTDKETRKKLEDYLNLSQTLKERDESHDYKMEAICSFPGSIEQNRLLMYNILTSGISIVWKDPYAKMLTDMYGVSDACLSEIFYFLLEYLELDMFYYNSELEMLEPINVLFFSDKTFELGKALFLSDMSKPYDGASFEGYNYGLDLYKRYTDARLKDPDMSKDRLDFINYYYSLRINCYRQRNLEIYAIKAAYLKQIQERLSNTIYLTDYDPYVFEKQIEELKKSVINDNSGKFVELFLQEIERLINNEIDLESSLKSDLINCDYSLFLNKGLDTYMKEATIHDVNGKKTYCESEISKDSSSELGDEPNDEVSDNATIDNEEVQEDEEISKDSSSEPGDEQNDEEIAEDTSCETEESSDVTEDETP